MKWNIRPKIAFVVARGEERGSDRLSRFARSHNQVMHERIPPAIGYHRHRQQLQRMYVMLRHIRYLGSIEFAHTAHRYAALFTSGFITRFPSLLLVVRMHKRLLFLFCGRSIGSVTRRARTSVHQSVCPVRVRNSKNVLKPKFA